MKRFLISFYFRQRGSCSRSGEYLGDNAFYGNKVWKGENFPQDDAEIRTLEKELASSIQAGSLTILTVSPLQ